MPDLLPTTTGMDEEILEVSSRNEELGRGKSYSSSMLYKMLVPHKIEVSSKDLASSALTM